MWFQRAYTDEHETVYEIVSQKDKLGFGLAVVYIDDKGSNMHEHNKIAEIYLVLSGKLRVYTEDRNLVDLSPGESIEIAPNIIHSARAIESDEAMFLVVSIPAWQKDDHLAPSRTPTW